LHQSVVCVEADRNHPAQLNRIVSSSIGKAGGEVRGRVYALDVGKAAQAKPTKRGELRRPS
jgi:hypothetical protein